MHSPNSVVNTWYEARDYCNKSSGRLARVSGDVDSQSFINDLAKRINATGVWIGSSRAGHSRFLGYNKKCVVFDGTKETLTKCTSKLPFICERGKG